MGKEGVIWMIGFKKIFRNFRKYIVLVSWWLFLVFRRDLLNLLNSKDGRRVFKNSI